MADSPPPLLTPKEAAARLAITLEQLTALVFDGEIAYIAIGRGQKRPRRRFTEADIEEFIERRRRREMPFHATLHAHRSRRRSAETAEPVGFMARLAAERERKSLNKAAELQRRPSKKPSR